LGSKQAPLPRSEAPAVLPNLIASSGVVVAAAYAPRAQEHRPASGVPFPGRTQAEVGMATKQNGQIIETAGEARQAEPGPSVLALLSVSTGLAVLILGVVWFVFFRT
jgi:hypothetical protein